MTGRFVRIPSSVSRIATQPHESPTLCPRANRTPMNNDIVKLPTATRRQWFGGQSIGQWCFGWLRLELIDALLVALALCLVVHSRGSMLDDPGLGWHLRNVDAMWTAGGWLTADSFSGPRGGQPWRTNQWLGDLALRGGYWLGGLEGIAAVTIAVLLIIFRAMYAVLRADGVGRLAAVAWTAAAALGTAPAWMARPNVFSVLAIMLTAWLVDRFHRGRCSPRALLWLLPLMVVWTNTHGGFLAGLVVLAVAWAVELVLAIGLPYYGEGKGALGRLAHLSWLLPAAAACTLINPYGWNIYPWVLKLLGNPFFMNLNMEWQSPNFHGRGALCFEPLILLLPLLLATSRRRASLTAVVLSVVWLHFALSGYRYVALWVVVTVPMLAQLSVDVPMLRKLGRWFQKTRERRTATLSVFGGEPSHGNPSFAELQSGFWRRRTGTKNAVTQQQPGQERRESWLGLIALVAALFAWSATAEGHSGHDPRHIPTAALEHVIEHYPDRVVLHDCAWGGWLTWHGWPTLRNWIDDRNEVQGEQHIRDYQRLVGAQLGWQKLLEERKIDVVCLRPNAPLVLALKDDPRWVEVYADPYAVVLEQQAP